MKNFGLILFVLFTISCNAKKNEINYSSTHFIISDTNRLNKNCEFFLECDCCSSHLILNNDSTFFEILECVNETIIDVGIYSLNSKELILSYKELRKSKVLNPEFDKNTTSKKWNYEINERKIEEVKLLKSECDDKIIFQSKDKTVLQSHISSEEYLLKFEEEDVFLAAKNYLLLELDPLNNLNKFDENLDTIIAEQLMNYLNADLIQYSDESQEFYYENSGWNEYKISYAPDQSFKIITIIGEACGMSCLSTYYNVIQLKSGEFIRDVDLNDVNKIIPFKENKYYILTEGWSGGTNGIVSKSIVQYKMENDSLIPYSFYKGVNINQFQIYSMWFNLEADINTTINKDEIIVKYIHAVDERYLDDEKYEIPSSILNAYDDKEEEEILVKGTFQIINGKIENHNKNYSIFQIE